MIKKYIFLGMLFLAGFFLAFSGCKFSPTDPVAGNVPEAKHQSVTRAWTAEQVDALVKMETVSIFSPAPVNPLENAQEEEQGYNVPPAECDYIKFIRYKVRSADNNASKADAALIMIPGVVEGANGFEYIARQVVYIAKTQYGKNFEVWAFDRRNNCLEDLTGLKAAEQQATSEAAANVFLNYYYNGKKVNGKTFNGFVKDYEIPFVSEFGLKMDTEDIYKIITTMIPDPVARKNKVFVGGHSMGGIHTAIFAGWDFNGDPGYNNCAGLFALDSTISTSIGMAQAAVDSSGISSISDFITQMISEGMYDTLLYMLREGTMIRTVPIIKGEVGAIMEILGFLAHRFPTEENVAQELIPLGANTMLLNRLFHSSSLTSFLDGSEDIRNYRYTNEALLGVLFDDDFAPLGMIKISLGFLNGGIVEPKNFPLSSDITSIPELYDLISMIGDGRLYIAGESGDGAPLYTWANFDQIGTAADPNYQSADGSLTYTTFKDEVSDINDFARAQYYGSSNLIEWSFSMRRLIDLMAIAQGYNQDYGLNFLYGDKIKDVPQITFISGEGMLKYATAEELAALPGQVQPLMTGYEHMDPMFAACDRPGFKDSKVIKPLIEFVLENTGN